MDTPHPPDTQQRWTSSAGLEGRDAPGARPGRYAPELDDDRIHDRLDEGEGLARVLGWFSIGLGVAQTLAPDTLTRLVGAVPTETTRNTMRAVGAREIITGIGILANPDPSEWVKARIAGDAMDLSLLGRSLGNGERDRTAGAMVAVLGAAALDLNAARRLGSSSRAREVQTPRDPIRGIRVHKSMTIRRPVDEVYAFWRDFENLPRFMRHLETVEVLDGKRSRWKAKAPAGLSVSWEAVITEERPNELIAWRSAKGATVENAGVVWFRPAPGDRGTEIHVRLHYDPPGGRLTSTLALLFREEPGQQVKDDLRAFKQMMEVGEVVVSDATVSRGPHPGRPPGGEEEQS
ncbi:MAG: SRPBCC family protein [Gemmatimonadetes bacterium]|nr:SRPBCC family protein [Gemmatimonadota bacterium]